MESKALPLLSQLLNVNRRLFLSPPFQRGFSGDGNDFGDSSSSSGDGFGILGLFLNKWRSRVATNPQFPFKVLIEELVGVFACVLGDMASHPNFGLNEHDFVFSTLVVRSIVNFTLMYLWAPTMYASSPNLPSIFANCPTSHMFEPGAYTVFTRFGTFLYKGVRDPKQGSSDTFKCTHLGRSHG
ncbi:hypothetical protein CIPAW_05G131800 [Carya illinoinensis]|uniref:Uncharacterized protein n=1 Tax=Carya illinoinensis TaxID=32201 RepID=A0A8T1QI21_CARIL|nr:hypothetical protein CIPAW_05G131800 [Carya illinoinensis]